MYPVLEKFLNKLRGIEEEDYDTQENFGDDAGTITGALYSSVGTISLIISIWLIYNNRQTFMPAGRSKLVTILYMLLVLAFNGCCPPALPLVLVMYYGFKVKPVKETEAVLTSAFGKNFFK